ncbi:protein FAM110C [Echinops telfairi]|uniref:Protein FAM110C n=1 Tax=Echinops telfairi TaxID=9371 RepID=A0ABM0IU55_ECHTE|nr:protein FAM110C [Echinops telfairi]
MRCQLSGQSSRRAPCSAAIGWRAPGGWFDWKVKKLAGGASRARRSQWLTGLGHRPGIRQLAGPPEFTPTRDPTLGARGRESPIRASRKLAAVPRRPIARRPLRPDSLVIYRQKCELVKGTGGDSLRAGLVKKLFQGPGKDRALLTPEMPKGREEVKTEGPDAMAKGEDAAAPKAAGSSPEPCAVAGSVPPAVAPDRSRPGGTPSRCQPTPPGSELREVRHRGLHRSQSDVSSRYSKSFAEGLDTFFLYCGLDPEVVEALGRENFAAGSDHLAFKVRSVSIATSDSGFSLHSGGDDGLQEEELIEQAPTKTSVIEKNARIIKWLYTCKKAKETPSKGQ